MNNKQTALLLIDLQNDFCHPDGTASKRGRNVHAFTETLHNIARLLETARTKELPVIHVISEHSRWTQSPSGNERFGRSSQTASRTYCEPNSWGAEIDSLFTPLENELIVKKHRYSAFVHTDLELILHAQKINQLIIAGIYTNVCIDSTARDAYMRDFFVTIPSDCVTSNDEKLHHYALALLQGTFADVMHSNALIKQL